MGLTLKAVNQLDMAKTPIAMEVTASSSDLRAWVAVYPPHKQPNNVADIPTTGRYLVKRFEYRRGMEDTYDTDLYTSNLEERFVGSISEVERILDEWSVDASLMMAPWRSDFPL